MNLSSKLDIYEKYHIEKYFIKVYISLYIKIVNILNKIIN